HDHVVEPSGGHRHLRAGAQVAGEVLGFTAQVLLPVGRTDLDVPRHHDAGLRAVDPRLPRALRAGDAPVLELLGVLAHVPDVPSAVLGVPVTRVFRDFAATRDGVAHDGDRHTEHGLVLVGHLDVVVLGFALVVAVEDPMRADRQRIHPVVDDGHEVGG